MGCEADVMELEQQFLGGLAAVTDAARIDDTASLNGEGVAYTFEALQPVPTAALVGETWVLDTLISGPAASSTVSNAAPATLLLSADGTFTGSTGCRTISGVYVVTGDTVQFTSWSASGDCEPEVEAQDSQVISVLEAGFVAEIDGARLTVTVDGGEGLSYTLED